MAKLNISASLTAEKVAEIKTHLEAIRNAMPFLINISTSEKSSLQKLGTGSLGFVEDALNVSKNHGNILPSNFNVEEFEKDVKLTADLNDINTVLMPIAESVSDTLTVVGGEAMKQSNIVYSQVKLSAKNNESMKELGNRMGERYKKSKSSKSTQTPVS